MALSAGSLLLKHQEIPIADVLIAFPVKLGGAAYVVMDDSYYKILGIRTNGFEEYNSTV